MPSNSRRFRRKTTLNRFAENQATRARAAPPDTTIQHAERQLLDGVERILRAPPGRLVGWALLALHLSNIPPPGPRAHHRRVAAAVLDDAAARSNGQLFALSNGDIALLFRPPDGGLALSTVLARLFQADVSNLDELRTLWFLPQAAIPALEYVRATILEGDRTAPSPDPQASTSAIAAMDDVVQNGALSDLMNRQTAVLLRPGRAVPLAPLFREVAISTAVLEARFAPGGQATADPFLFNHLGGRLDPRVLRELRDDIPIGGMLSTGLGPAALHVNMTVPGILSEQFSDFASACKEAIARGVRVGVEIPFVEAFSNITSFIIARERLRLAGLYTVVDCVSHHALALTSPAVLGATFVKLDWAPAMSENAADLLDAVARLGPGQIVLNQADDEAAIAWGLARGIMRFQGGYVDRMLAAARLRACPDAKSCNLRLCSERASATGRAGRAGCTNTTLLDAAAPTEVAFRPVESSPKIMVKA